MTRTPQTSTLAALETCPQMFTLASLLLTTVSRGAQEYRLAPVFYGFRLNVDYAVTPEDIFLGSVSQYDPAMGFLARVCLWLKLLFMGCDESEVAPERKSAPRPQKTFRDIPANRKSRRRENRTRPVTNSTYALGHILLRRWGYRRFVQWLYNCTLTSRARRCFRLSARGAKKRTSLNALLAGTASAFCAAPLCPD